MTEFEFNVHTLCLMEKTKLRRLLKNHCEHDENENFTVLEIQEALRVYDKKEYKEERDRLKKEV